MVALLLSSKYAKYELVGLENRNLITCEPCACFVFVRMFRDVGSFPCAQAAMPARKDFFAGFEAEQDKQEEANQEEAQQDNLSPCCIHVSLSRYGHQLRILIVMLRTPQFAVLSKKG